MEVSFFSVGVAIYIIFALSRTFLRFRDEIMSFRQMIFWSFLWLGAAYVLLYPHNSDEVAQKVGLSRGIDVVVYVSIMVIFYLIFRTYVTINHMQQETTRLVRAIALEGAKQKSVEKAK